MECHGVPEFVIVNGRVCVDDEQLRAVEGYGKYVETPTFPPFLYDLENAEKIAPVKNGVSHDSRPMTPMSKVWELSFVKEITF